MNRILTSAFLLSMSFLSTAQPNRPLLEEILYPAGVIPQEVALQNNISEVTVYEYNRDTSMLYKEYFDQSGRLIQRVYFKDDRTSRAERFGYHKDHITAYSDSIFDATGETYQVSRLRMKYDDNHLGAVEGILKGEEVDWNNETRELQSGTWKFALSEEGRVIAFENSDTDDWYSGAITYEDGRIVKWEENAMDYGDSVVTKNAYTYGKDGSLIKVDIIRDVYFKMGNDWGFTSFNQQNLFNYDDAGMLIQRTERVDNDEYQYNYAYQDGLLTAIRELCNDPGAICWGRLLVYQKR